MILLISVKRINLQIILPNIQIIYLSQNKYYIITADQIYFYLSSPESVVSPYTFIDNQKITTAEESEMISYGAYKNDNIAHLVVVKNYIYAILEKTYYCNVSIEEIKGYRAEIFPLKCIEAQCYYILGIINSTKSLNLFLYSNAVGYCISYLRFTYTVNNIASDTFSCQLMESHAFGELLTCFYEIDNNIIIANSLTINLNLAESKIESVFNKAQNNNGAKIIKSKLSQDQTKSYVCYINNNNNCDCLTYTILTNEWSDSTNYINACLSKPTSLIFDYYDVSNEYFLYCFESDSKINIVKLDENFLITSKYNNDTYKSFEGCSQQFLSNLVYNSNDIRIFRVCNDDLKNILIGEFADLLPTTIITTIITTFPKTTILTALPETTFLTKIDETTILATLFETTVLTPLNIIETTIPVNMILIPTSLPLKTIISTILILPHNQISSTNLFIEPNLENPINLLSTTPFVDNKGENKEIIII